MFFSDMKWFEHENNVCTLHVQFNKRKNCCILASHTCILHTSYKVIKNEQELNQLNVKASFVIANSWVFCITIIISSQYVLCMFFVYVDFIMCCTLARKEDVWKISKHNFHENSGNLVRFNKQWIFYYD